MICGAVFDANKYFYLQLTLPACFPGIFLLDTELIRSVQSVKTQNSAQNRHERKGRLVDIQRWATLPFRVTKKIKAKVEQKAVREHSLVTTQIGIRKMS